MRFKSQKSAKSDHADAEAVAAQALAFLTADPGRMARFLADSGMDPSDLQMSLAAGGEGVLLAGLDHIVCDESLLLVFASELRRKPDEIMRAYAVLQGPAALTTP